MNDIFLNTENWEDNKDLKGKVLIDVNKNGEFTRW